MPEEPDYSGLTAPAQHVSEYNTRPRWQPGSHSHGRPPHAPHQGQPPPIISGPDADKFPLTPQPVVKMWSTRGLEYAMMIVTLWISAAAAAWALLNVVNGNGAFNYLVVPTSALVVCLPIFAIWFIRLKKSEMKNPVQRADPSRRRWTQLTQFLAFITVIINLIVLVYEIMARYGTNKSDTRPLSKTVLDSAIILVIAGGILVYFWLDEHRPIQS